MINLTRTTLTAALLGGASLIATGALAAGQNEDRNDAAYKSGAGDDGRIEIGYLECDMTSDEGNIIVSEQQYVCAFDPAEEGMANEVYVAKISKIGLDLSKTDEETIRWGVFAPAEKYREGVLEGEYAGVSADVAVGLGAGAKILVGGLEESVALQPVSVTTQDGVGVALAIENLTLTHMPEKS
ncbi:MAG: DUF992 domain-containing protein [Paracoccaceae bacterium]